MLASDLPARIKRSAGGRWPAGFGDAIEFGCDVGSMAHAMVCGQMFRSLLVVDTDLAPLQAYKGRIAGLDASRPVLFAALGPDPGTIRDAVADTVIGTAVLAETVNLRAFLTTVHRILKIGGRAVFVVPNRRYHQAASLAMAEALAQRYARDGAWPEGCGRALALLGETRHSLVHRGDLHSLEQQHFFDGDALEDLAQQIGFGTAEVLPLDPDPAGGDTITRLYLDAGASDDFAREFGPLAATVGRPYLSLLHYQDSSALSLLWLTKATAPAVRIFTDRTSGPPFVCRSPDATVGGMLPRWSIELLARDTPDGVILMLGGWCLSNIDTLWVRITLDGVAQQAPVWRHRPDVHEVLNRAGVYHVLNALCSGLEASLLFAGVHPRDNRCTLGIEVVLTGNLIVTGPAAETLMMDQPTVIAH
jgi:hypothetical protein